MSDPRFCGNADVLMSYLYQEDDTTGRLAFEAHMATCAACAGEVADLRGVRGGLAGWEPPEMLLDFRIVRGTPPPRRFAWLAFGPIPAWAQLAAASLVVAVAVGVSGLEIRYDASGLVVRTGWSKAATPAQAAAAAVPAPPVAAPWRTELTALEQRLRDELKQPASPAVQGQLVAARGARAMSDDEFLARMRELVEASETRQQRELALRLTQVVREMDSQRRTDLARLVDGMGVLEGRTGAAVAQQRELMNYLVRVSQRQQ